MTVPDDTSPAPPAPLVLAGFMPYRFSILAERLSRGFARHYSTAFGLSIPEWRVMAVLGEHSPCSTGDVITRTEMDRVKVSRAVIRLAGRNLLTQTPQPGDQRAHRLALTPDGLDIYRRILPMAHRLQAEFLAVLDQEEREATDRILAKLLASAGRLLESSPESLQSD